MPTRLLSTIFLSLIAFVGIAQPHTWDQVYNLMQTKCAIPGCHDNGTQTGGLDLQGAGASAQQNVYNAIVGGTPANSYASSQGYEVVFPGDPYRSSIFRKINAGLDPYVTLNGSEGGNMPQGSSLTDEEKELIRQWIVFGARDTGYVADTNLIAQYYGGNGIDGVPNPIAAPAPGQGFQIKVGPFFLPALGEDEFYTKYPIRNAANMEVMRMDNEMGTSYSHHFLVYRFTSNQNQYLDGLRHKNAHYHTDFVAAYGQSDSLKLPAGTGWRWGANTILDLNTHYVNYDNSKVLKCETFVNIYTQTYGTAVHEMKSQLIPYVFLIIPNNGQTMTFTHNIFDTAASAVNDDMFIWAMSSHTHQWGKSFEVNTRDINGQIDTKIYDAERLHGVPGGQYIGYDYQHPPTRYWYYPFMPVKKNEGLISVATFNNTGGQTVYWGPTSDDEMMITGIMFIEDTTGLGIVSGINHVQKGREILHLYPNPSTGMVNIALPPGEKPAQIRIVDLMGREVMNEALRSKQLNLQYLSAGTFIVTLRSDNGTVRRTKLIISE